MNKLSERDRRAVLLLGAALILVLIYRMASSPDNTPVVEASRPSIAMAEKSLAHLRQVAATVPGKEKVLETVTAQVNEREQKILNADTGAQAQAQLLQIVRRVAHSEGPPIEIGQVNMGQILPFGKNYGEALITVTFQSSIDQLLNLLADLSAQPELIATSDLNIGAGDQKQKILAVRLTLSALVDRKLVPERKGFGAF